MRSGNEDKFIVALASCKDQLATKVGIIWNSVRKPHTVRKPPPLPYIAYSYGNSLAFVSGTSYSVCLYRGSSPQQGERVVIVAICDSDPVCVQVSTNVYATLLGHCLFLQGEAWLM